MVLGKDNTQQQAQTTVTTRSTAVPTTGVQQAPGSITTKEPIVTNVLEKPVIGNVIEQKNIEVHNRPVIQEVHQQKIIEIQKQPVVQNVQQQPLIQSSRAAPVFQEVGTSELGEQERLRLDKLRLQQQPVVSQQQSVQQFNEGERIAQVIKQENIERHVQPVVTEIRQQKVVQEVVQPIVRKVHEAPIIREVTTQPIMQQQPLQQGLQQQGLQQQPLQSGLQQGLRTGQGYTADTGRFHTYAPKAGGNLLKAVSCSGKLYTYGLSNDGQLFHLSGREGEQNWQLFDVGGFRLRDISVARGGSIFGIGMDGLLYRLHGAKFEPVLVGDTQRLASVSAMSKRKIYAVGEDGQPLFIKLARFGHNNVWERLGAIRLQKISTGGRLLRRTEVWGLGQDGSAYRWFGDQWVPFNVQLRDLSVALDNAVYGVSKEGRLLKWDGQDLFLLQDRELSGDNRDYIRNARLTHVTAYKEGNRVYALEEGTGNLLRMLF